MAIKNYDDDDAAGEVVEGGEPEEEETIDWVIFILDGRGGRGIFVDEKKGK
jgi:hypothetical protein